MENKKNREFSFANLVEEYHEISRGNFNIYWDVLGVFIHQQGEVSITPKQGKKKLKIVNPSLTLTFGTTGRQNCQLCAPSSIYLQENSMVLLSVRGWVDPSTTECGKKKEVTWMLPGIEPGTTRVVRVAPQPTTLQDRTQTESVAYISGSDRSRSAVSLGRKCKNWNASFPS